MYGQWEGKGLKKLITDAEVLLYRASGEKRPYKMKIQERYDKKIRSIARRIAHSLPDGALLEEGDLHSYGVLGLLDALGKFDLTRPNLFGTYIDGKYGRIEGTIVDALRGVDHATRTERENVKKVRNFERDFRKGNNRDPRRGEIIGGLNVSEQFVSDVSVTRNVSHAPFDGYGGEDDGVRPYNETLTAQSLDTRTNREQSDRSAVLRRALAILTPGEQELVVRYFWKGQKLLEIGDALGVTESRMSQRLTEITNKLGNIADLREVL
jgi:RNA polymerase sigma factor for flagellar operon FliA